MHRFFQTPKNFWVILATVFLITIGAASQCFAALEEGQAAPNLRAVELDGKTTFDLNQEKGHVVLIQFWASWCSICLHELPILDRYYLAHKDQGLRVLAISIDDPEDEKKAIKIMRAYHLPAAFSKNAHYDAYGRIWRTPITFIIDRKGILNKDGSTGAPFNFDQAELEKVVTPLLK